jgi:hypothetical protein
MSAADGEARQTQSVIVDERRARRRGVETVGGPLDLGALAERTNDDGHAYPISATRLEAWLVDGGLARRGDDGRLRLKREAWSLAGQRFHSVSPDEARTRLYEHVPEIEEGELGEVQIRLVAGSFGPAVTSVVLWLRDYSVDIGCVQLTARLLNGESAMITGRQLLPLPVTEDYVVRRRRREQEQERVRRSRRISTVKTLAEAGIIQAGTTIRVAMDNLWAAWRPGPQNARMPASGSAWARRIARGLRR